MSDETKTEQDQKRSNVNLTPPGNPTNQSNSDSSKAQTEFFDALSDPNKPKKSSFQITKITVKTDDRKEESQDDLDETTNTEDLSLDASRTGDVEHEPSSASTVHSPGGTDDAVWSSLVQNMGEMPANAHRTSVIAAAKDKTQDTHSRFKVVKIESQDRLKRGRWTCTTFLDPGGKTGIEGVVNSQTDSIFYVPLATEDHPGAVIAPIVFNEGHLVLKTNPNIPPLYVVRDDSKMQYLIGSVPSTDNERTEEVPGADQKQFYPVPDRPASSSISNKELEKLQPPPPSLDPSQSPGSPPVESSRLGNKRAGCALSSNSPLMAMVNATMSSSSFSDVEDG